MDRVGEVEHLVPVNPLSARPEEELKSTSGEWFVAHSFPSAAAQYSERVDRRSAEFRSLSCDRDPLSPHFVLSGFMHVADNRRRCADL
jgi:hypothetical protein